MRDSIIFYRSFYEAICGLPLQVQAKVYSAIFEYSLNYNEVVLEGLPKAIFTLIKPQLDANNKRFENGKKGGRKKDDPAKTETKTEPKPNQELTEIEANNNVFNVNDNVNVNKNTQGAEVCVLEEHSIEKKVLRYFNFNEIANPNHFRTLNAFVKKQRGAGRLDYFLTQFEGYCAYKEASGEKKHNLNSFLGPPERQFEGGEWDAANWIIKLTELNKQKNAKSATTNTTAARQQSVADLGDAARRILAGIKSA